MKRILILGVCAVPFFFASCGGGESDSDATDTDSTVTENVEEEMTIVDYTIDTAASVINWNNFNGEEVDHAGTVKVLDGTMQVTTTNGDAEITAAALTVDMNSISEGSENLEMHLKNEDFFDVNTYATTSFEFDRHENDMIYGTAMIVGKSVAIEAPATVSMNGEDAVVEVGEFTIDFSALEMPFFVKEAEEAKEEEKHDPVIGFSANIVGKK